MASGRSAELLRLAADALVDGQDPLHISFLREHDVTADECMTLADFLAIGARMVAKAIESPKSMEGKAMMFSIVDDAMKLNIAEAMKRDT